jgi:hypothetical protein
MKKMLIAVLMVALMAVPALAFEQSYYQTDGASLFVKADQMGGTLSATVPFHIDYFKVGGHHGLKVQNLDGVLMVGATGGMQEMMAKGKANGSGDYYYYYGYNTISWSQNQSGSYNNKLVSDGMYMKQSGSFSQNQNISVQAPSSNYYAY